MKIQNKKNGFTMIELIFVIVILGILSAIAIPKLASTRDDAKKSTFIANVKTCINDIGSSYTATGTAITSTIISDFKSCSEANSYIVDSIIVDINDSSAIVVTNTDTNMDTTHIFGGTSVVY